MKRIISLAIILISLSSITWSADIHKAVSRGDLTAIKQIITNNPNEVNSLDEATNTPLHLACTVQNIDIINFLIESGANLEAETKYGLTPLFSAVHSNSKKAASILLKSGAQVNHISRIFGTPLHRAVFVGDSAMIMILIRYSADCDIKNIRGRTPLHDAAIYGNVPAVEIMLSAGADPNLPDLQNRIPLHWAMISGIDKLGYNNAFPLAKLLLPVCSDINLKDSDGYTPIAYAVENGNTESVYLLCKFGADLLWLSPLNSRSLLHICAVKGYGEIASYLARTIDDPFGAGTNNYTPLDLALKHGNISVARVFDPTIGVYDIKNGAFYLNQRLDNNEALIWKLDTRGWAIKTRTNLLIFDQEESGTKPDHPSLSNGWIDSEEIRNENVTAFYSAYHGLPGTLEFLHSIEDRIKNIRFIHYRDDRWRGPGNSFLIKGDTTMSFPKLTFRSYETKDSYGMGSLGYLIKSDGVNLFYPNFFTDDLEVFKTEVDKLVKFQPGCQIMLLDMNPGVTEEFIDYLITHLKPALIIPYDRTEQNKDTDQKILDIRTKWPNIKFGMFYDPGDMIIFPDILE